VEKVLQELSENFDYIVCDSPAGIEHGATMAMYFADDAIVVTNPEVSSVRDSDRMLGILASKSRRAINGSEPIREYLLLSRYSPQRVKNGEMLGVDDVQEILSLHLLGVIPESQAVLNASNSGTPVILDMDSDPARPMTIWYPAIWAKTCPTASWKSKRKASSVACSEVDNGVIGLFSIRKEKLCAGRQGAFTDSGGPRTVRAQQAVLSPAAATGPA
jgi:septum formation inhibitor-activating ATPase MinD